MRRRWLARATGTVTILIGLAHIGVGVRSYDDATIAALWFYGSGLAVILIGALTLLDSSPRSWGTLSAVALVANLAGLALAVTFGVRSQWSELPGPLLTTVFVIGALSVLPITRRT